MDIILCNILCKIHLYCYNTNILKYNQCEWKYNQCGWNEIATKKWWRKIMQKLKKIFGVKIMQSMQQYTGCIERMTVQSLTNRYTMLLWKNAENVKVWNTMIRLLRGLDTSRLSQRYGTGISIALNIVCVTG